MPRLNDLQILITADESYRAFEKAVLSAKCPIEMGLRLFDPRTPLLSAAAKEIGNTWVSGTVAREAVLLAARSLVQHGPTLLARYWCEWG